MGGAVQAARAASLVLVAGACNEYEPSLVPTIPGFNDAGLDASGQGSYSSQICPDLTGGAAAFWDIQNGIPVRLAEVPSPKPGWANFMHPNYPPLSFLYPSDWTANPISGNQTAGVNVIRPDNRALWRWLGTWGDTGRGARAYRDAEVREVLDLLGAGTDTRVLCENEAQASPAAGITQDASNVILEAGGFTIMVAIGLTSMQGLPGGQIVVAAAAAPTGEFDRVAFEVFLPIGFQLLYGHDTVQDSDGDGYPDGQDGSPYDPNQH